MSQARRILALAGLLAVLAVALSGCVHLDRTLALNTDGTGTFTVAIGFSDKLVSLGGASFVQQLDACGARAKAAGGSYARNDDGTYSTWAFTWRFESLDRLNDLLRTDTSFCRGQTGTSSAALTSGDTFQVFARTHFFTTTFVVTGHMSFTLPPDVAASHDPSVAALVQQARDSFTVSMPLWVTSHTSGGAVNGSSVTYTVHAGDSLDFEVVGGGPSPSGVLVAAGGLIFLLAGLLLIRRVTRRPTAADVARAERAAPEVPVAPGAHIASPWHPNPPVSPPGHTHL